MSLYVVLCTKYTNKICLNQERRYKIVRNRVFDCHLSPDRRQMAIENTVTSDFYPRSSIVRAFSIAVYPA